MDDTWTEGVKPVVVVVVVVSAWLCVHWLRVDVFPVLLVDHQRFSVQEDDGAPCSHQTILFTVVLLQCLHHNVLICCLYTTVT